MSDHTTALVPIAPWSYVSPELIRDGKAADIGLLCEALIHYERIIVVSRDAAVFAAVLAWFIEQNRYQEFLSLLKDEVITFCHYKFRVDPAWNYRLQAWGLFNLVSDDRPSDFQSEILNSPAVRQMLPHARKRSKLYEIGRDHTTEISAELYGDAVRNADVDYQNPKRAALLLQALVDDVYPLAGLGKSPEISATISGPSDRITTTWNIDFSQLKQAGIGFRDADVLRAAAESNRLLWSAAQFGCDLYLPSPISNLVGDKLYESFQQVNPTHEIIEQLIAEVEYPDIRRLVNRGEVKLDTVLDLRRHSNQFRHWLQDETGRDRNAALAYLNESAQASGWRTTTKLLLPIFGVLGGAVGTKVGGIPGGIAGSIVSGPGLQHVANLALKLDKEWKPVVFGKWAMERIRKKLGNRSRPLVVR